MVPAYLGPAICAYAATVRANLPRPERVPPSPNTTDSACCCKINLNYRQSSVCVVPSLYLRVTNVSSNRIRTLHPCLHPITRYLTALNLSRSFDSSHCNQPITP